MQEKKKGDTELRMNALSLMLKEVYIPLIDAQEIKHHMQRFNTQIGTSIQQAYGQITIDVPYFPQDWDEERIQRDTELLKKLQDAVNTWTQMITEIMNKQSLKAKQKVHDTASGETEFWSARAATYNTLYQQLSMPRVRKIIQILGNVKESSENSFNVEGFKQKEKDFKKEHAVAKDFVKFLLTLERQFKNIGKGDLKSIEDTLPSLLNGLKLIWTISRHINHQVDEFQDIIEAISNEICTKVREKINIKTIFKKRPEEAIEDIAKAIAVLEKWQSEFNTTRMNIENETTITRWEFPKAKDILSKPKHIILICRDIKEVCVAIKDFAAILNNDLKAVTQGSEDIDNHAERVKDQVNKLQAIQNEVFNAENINEWRTAFTAFTNQLGDIEQGTITLIDSTFQNNLNSSLHAFELLQNFKHIETRQRIHDCLDQKYAYVLKKYKAELEEMKKLFKENQDDPLRPKNMPENSGKIAWARSIITRIKTPIDRFKTKPDILYRDQDGQTAAKLYVELAKMLTENYENKIYKDWEKENSTKVLTLLKQNILREEIGKDRKRYKIDFDPSLKVIIREAKFLDRIGKSIPDTIINIALQEKDYARHIDKLNQLLRSYDSVLDDLKPIETTLLKSQIEILNNTMHKGVSNHNWFSLSIPEYIKECTSAIETFRVIKTRVIGHAFNLQKKIENIESAVVIRPISASLEVMGLTDFSEYFDSHRTKTVTDLIHDYEEITNFLRQIEQTAFNHESLCHPQMETYYQYWERKIFNALISMTIRALATNKAIWERNDMISQTCKYVSPEFQYDPTPDDMIAQLQKFTSNIIDVSMSFGRWYKGYCEIVAQKKDEENSEKQFDYSFYEDLCRNGVVTLMVKDITDKIHGLSTKQSMHSDKYLDKQQKKITNEKTGLQKIQREIERNRSVRTIEGYIMELKKKKKDIKTKPDKVRNALVLVDYSAVKKTLKDSVQNYLVALGKSLTDIAKNDLQDIQNTIADYTEQLSKEDETIEEIKFLLEAIAKIRNSSMDMELKIAEVQEQFRVLAMYKYTVDPQETEAVAKIAQEWADLMEAADKKDQHVNTIKGAYSEMTMQQVEDFKKQLRAYYEEYIEIGPGADTIDLDQGLQKLEDAKLQCETYSLQKEEMVLSESLFGLEISTFEELIKMENANAQYSLIYEIYRMYREQRNEWSTITWLRLEAETLDIGSTTYVDKVRKLEKQNKEMDKLPPFQKLKQEVKNFKESLPLIKNLMDTAVVERHWKRIMEETGKDIGEINLKTFTLAKVFELNLQNYEEKVIEICREAKEEKNNEKEIQKIDDHWKGFFFEVYQHTNKTTQEVKGLAIKSPDEVRQAIDDDIMILQAVGNSKYARAIKDKVARWELDLNMVSDVIDIWLQVQRKWIYLESIFSSEDIKLQLAEEAKKFQKINKTYTELMEKVQKDRRVLHQCKEGEGGKLNQLKGISAELDKCQKSLTQYLESKRMVLARFYFISDEDLLQILGTSDPKAITPHLLKLYDNNKEMTFGPGNKTITHMTSDEGESYMFENPVKPEGNIEDWMTRVDTEMKKTLHVHVKKAVFYYAQKDRVQWVTEQLGMVALVGSQIWWTFCVEDVFHKRQAGDKQAMKNELKRESDQLNILINLMRTDLEDKARASIRTMIVLDVHARDIVADFVRDSVMSTKEFDWEKQLRFYWDQKNDDIEIRQCTGKFTYSYEYQGLNGRLVITPLTDRCVMTLTTALTFYLGGAPEGPAGTGKTETVKDLAKSLALRCVVTCCGEDLDSKSLATIFSGLVQTGFWGCFDEFNRIRLEVLSVVSSQISTIQQSLRHRKEKFTFLGTEMNLVTTVGMFITMNPGYSGRSELPDNLKALFRPVTMVVPALQLICENMLMSEGFVDAKTLACKMTVLYKLAKDQLSKQYHYDFQLRALKSVLVMAGKLKREYSDTPENVVLMRALRDMNMPKFVYDDRPLFMGLIQDLFPDLKAERVGNEELKEHIIADLDKEGMKHSDEVAFNDQVNKCVQLFETTETRHTVMVVGPTGAGKSVILKTLANALEKKDGEKTKRDILNPKSLTINELYGVLNQDTRDWTDGLLSKIFKEANTAPTEDQKPEKRWIIYDGDVDAIWVENMNSVMDDNRILTLSNGDRIRLLKQSLMLFEVFDLQHASPATISRCGMVYVDPKNLGYAPYYDRWVRNKQVEYNENMYENLKELFLTKTKPIIERIFEGKSLEEGLSAPLRFITPRTDLNIITQLCTMIDAMMPPSKKDDEPHKDEDEAPQDIQDLEPLYLFCLIWSAGACIIEEDRKVFNDFVTTLSGTPGIGSFYDNFFDLKQMRLVEWKTKTKDYHEPLDKKFHSILVPTVDTTRYSWLLETILKSRQPKPVMFCGYTGAAKSVTVLSAFDNIASSSDGYTFLKINFSSRTSSADFQKNIEENIDKRTLKIWGPKTPGKKMIMFIDDLNMPTIDKYGTQKPNALLKFLVEYEKLYQRGGELLLRDIKDVFHAGCISPVAGGNNKVDPRLMSCYNTFNITNPQQESITSIYNNILQKKLAEFPEEVINCIEPLTEATVSLFHSLQEKLPRTPSKFHYNFNLRDLSRIYEGLYLSTLDKIKTKGQIVRMWRNECLRVFADKLIDPTDRGLVADDLLPALITKYFKDSQEEASVNPIIFGDFALVDPEDMNSEESVLRLYEDLGNYEDIREKMNRVLEEYSYSVRTMGLVLFDDALEHITKIHRIIRFDKGSGLLVGFGGSGKQSLTKLATYLASYDMFQITLKRNYKEDDFREEIRELYKTVIKKPTTFMFTDAHVVEEGFLELINNILTIGMVPALFPEDEKDGLKSQFDDEIRKKKLPTNKEFAWEYFVNRARANIHIVLCMSPAGEALRLRCRNFPGLITNTTIDWFFPWPKEALLDVAVAKMGEIDLNEDQREKVCEHLVLCHQSVQTYSKEFETQFKRKNYSTPKNYLDFIQNYATFLQQNRKSLTSQTLRLEGGLTTLAKAEADTKVLGDKLQIQTAEINEKKEKVEIIIKDVEKDSEIAGKKQKEVTKLSEQIAENNIIITKQKEEANEELKAAEPLLYAAKLALQKLEQKDLTELKAFNQVVPAIEKACYMAFLFFDKKALQVNDWAGIKAGFLSESGLLDQLKNKSPGEIRKDQANKAKDAIKKIEKDLGLKGQDLANEITIKSKAAGGLFRWVLATDECYDIFKQVEPKKEKAQKLEEQAAKSQKKKEELDNDLSTITANLKRLNTLKAEKQTELDALVAQANKMEKKLKAAAKLIGGLGSEQKRWTEDMEQFKDDKIKLVGDCLTASAFLSYCGPFNFILRKRMLFDHWKNNLVELGLPNKENFKLETFLTDDVEISKWASEKLPSDELSVQNGILTKMASRFPLCIDPQMQAISWIKTKESNARKSNFVPLSFNQPDYIGKLTIAIRYGHSVLFENIDTEIDPMIEPVLEKNIYKKVGVDYIKLGSEEIEYDEKFQLFLTTKIANPNYTPETFGKTMVINFNVTLQGLREQLLNDVVAFEKPQLEEDRKRLIKETADNKGVLKELEEKLLAELSAEQEMDLVDNEPLIAVLDEAKTKSVKIMEDLNIADITNEDINHQRENYKSCAKRGAILFFAMSGLTSISSMYEYSLSSFLVVFNNALKYSKQDNVLTQRLKFIRDKLTLLVYEFVCMGIFEKHKLMFTFQMATMIMDGEQELDKEELDFFLKGNTSLEKVEAKPFTWMKQVGWKDALRLCEMGGVWKNLVDDIRENEKSWKRWQDVQEPESIDVVLPCGYSQKLSAFQQLLLIRIFRTDRVINAIKLFIIKYMNEAYVKSPPKDYEKIYKQSTEKTPIVLILSPGADPEGDVRQLIENQEAMNPQAPKKVLKSLALGQGMGDEAKQMVVIGAQRGHWVMLHNCHLLIEWLKELEAAIDQINEKKPDKNFRLWLTTNEDPNFPLGILQKSIKVVNEPPDGLQANMFQLYTKLEDDKMDQCPMKEFKAFIYVLTFFHSSIQERKKFGKIGWNINYAFNWSDFKISYDLIELYLTKAHDMKDETLPWDTLRYLIGEAMYGGRVTDDWDRRVLMTYLDEYLGDFIFDKNQEFFFSRNEFDFKIPLDAENLEQTQNFISFIPLITVPEVFGLHSNAEIQYYNNSAKSLWAWSLEMQTSDGGDAGGANKDDYILTVQASLLEKIPGLYDMMLVKKQFEEGIISPTQVVLLQELERFNQLLAGMLSSLSTLKKALIGEIGMSSDLEEMANQIYNGFVPSKWLLHAPATLKNLVSWMDHFSRRNRQYQDWVDVEEPKVIWLSGLQSPESYITALVQTTCRAKNWPLDKSCIYTEVTKEKNMASIKTRLAFGTYVTGLFLEGARWNMDSNCLDYQHAKELVMEMPIVQIIPIEANKLKLRGTIKTPVYVTQNRKSAMGVGLVFEADLRTEKHPSHWILQGVALMLNMD